MGPTGGRLQGISSVWVPTGLDRSYLARSESDRGRGDEAEEHQAVRLDAAGKPPSSAVVDAVLHRPTVALVFDIGAFLDENGTCGLTLWSRGFVSASVMDSTCSVCVSAHTHTPE